MHITDDRGRRVRLLPQRQLGLVPAIPSPIPMHARDRMFADAHRIQFSREVMTASIIALLVVLAWCTLLYLLAPRLRPLFPLSPTTQSVITGITPFLPLPLMLWFVARSARQRVARVVADHGYCPSCGYALADIPTAADARTVCPECGSAWRIPKSSPTT